MCNTIDATGMASLLLLAICRSSIICETVGIANLFLRYLNINWLVLILLTLKALLPVQYKKTGSTIQCLRAGVSPSLENSLNNKVHNSPSVLEFSQMEGHLAI